MTNLMPVDNCLCKSLRLAGRAGKKIFTACANGAADSVIDGMPKENLGLLAEGVINRAENCFTPEQLGKTFKKVSQNSGITVDNPTQVGRLTDKVLTGAYRLRVSTLPDEQAGNLFRTATNGAVREVLQETGSDQLKNIAHGVVNRGTEYLEKEVGQSGLLDVTRGLFKEGVNYLNTPTGQKAVSSFVGGALDNGISCLNTPKAQRSLEQTLLTATDGARKALNNEYTLCKITRNMLPNARLDITTDQMYQLTEEVEKHPDILMEKGGKVISGAVSEVVKTPEGRKVLRLATQGAVQAGSAEALRQANSARKQAIGRVKKATKGFLETMFPVSLQPEI